MIPDLANIAAGAYKGYMNASGQYVDPIYLKYVLASTSTFAGVHEFFRIRKLNNNKVFNSLESFLANELCPKKPLSQGIKVGVLAVPVGAIEMALGYGLGYAAYKMSN